MCFIYLFRLWIYLTNMVKLPNFSLIFYRLQPKNIRLPQRRYPGSDEATSTAPALLVLLLPHPISGPTPTSSPYCHPSPTAAQALLLSKLHCHPSYITLALLHPRECTVKYTPCSEEILNSLIFSIPVAGIFRCFLGFNKVLFILCVHLVPNLEIIL